MKFRAHETFFIRKGWLSKGMKYVDAREDVFISKDENPMDVLGIGANMVKSLRYWLLAVGLTEEPTTGGGYSDLLRSAEVFSRMIVISKRLVHSICSNIALHVT